MFDPTTINSDGALQSVIDSEVPLAEVDILDRPTSHYPAGDYNDHWARVSWNNTSTTKRAISSNLLSGELTLHITRVIDGDFITASDLSSLWDFSNTTLKPFRMTKHRYASFGRNNGSWFLNQFAPLSIASSEGAVVGIAQVRLFASSNATTPLLVVSNAMVSNLISSNQTTRVTNFQWIRVEVDASADTGVTPIVFAHHNNTRYPLFDDGSHGDATGGDRTFTTYIYLQGSTLKHIQFDVLDRASVTSATSPHSATTWDVVLRAAIITDFLE